MELIDKAVRILFAIVLASLYFANVVSLVALFILLIVMGNFILTRFMNVSSLYWSLSIPSRKTII